MSLLRSFLAFLPLALAAPAPPRTIGFAKPDLPITADAETELWNHALSPGSTMGTVDHVWSTACGGRAIDWVTESGIAIYRMYIDGEATASVVVTPRMAVGIGFDPLKTNQSAAAPWGTGFIGKTSDEDGYFINIRIPFYKSIRITVQLPYGVEPFHVYSIVRGQENVPVFVSGHELPAGAKMVVHSLNRLKVPALHFIPMLNLTFGSGVIFAHALAIEYAPAANPFGFLEGCWHLITPFNGSTIDASAPGVGDGFPGVPLSTGMEDYYDSSFYFHAGMFQQEVSGVTHMCSYPPSAHSELPHPPCITNTSSQWSAYRFHHRDPLWFSGGVQLLARNGDVPGPTPWGKSAKCYNLDLPSESGFVEATVTSYVWAYHWGEETSIV